MKLSEPLDTYIILSLTPIFKIILQYEINRKPINRFNHMRVTIVAED